MNFDKLIIDGTPFFLICIFLAFLVVWPVFMWLSLRRSKQERRVERLKLQVREAELKRELLALEGRKAEYK